MKIIIRGPGDVSLIDDEGNDLIGKLHVRRITVDVEGSDFPTALIECEIFKSGVEAVIEGQNARATLNYLGVTEIREDII